MSTRVQPTRVLALIESLETRRLFAGPFEAGTIVTPWETTNIRSGPASSTVVGQAAPLLRGSVIGGPATAPLNGTQYTWYNIDWSTGPDGWSADQFLVTYAADVFPESLTLTPASGQAGSSINLGFRVRNRGFPETPATTAEIRLSNSSAAPSSTDPILGTVNVSALAGNGGQQVFSPTLVIPSSVSPGQKYLWVIVDPEARVWQWGQEGNDRIQKALNVTSPTVAPSKPVHIAPVNGVQVDGSSVTFRWQTSTNATKYELYVRDLTTNALSTHAIPGGSSAQHTLTLEQGRRYRWNMQAFNGATGSGTTTATEFDVRAPIAAPQLPAPWIATDIGAVAAGSAFATGGVFTIHGAGNSSWSTSDSLRFVHQRVSGDFYVSAQVSEIQSSGSTGTAGVMIRESTAASARFAAVLHTPGVGIRFVYRLVAGGAVQESAPVATSTPVTLRLTRQGEFIRALRSPNGQDWVEVGSASLAFPTTVDVGMAVKSGSPTQLARAVFLNPNIGTNVDGPIRVLKPDSPITLNSAQGGTTRYFHVQFPNNEVAFTVWLTGGTGNADLYAQYGERLSSFTGAHFASTQTGNNEAISIPIPQERILTIAVSGAAGFSDVKLEAHWTKSSWPVTHTSGGTAVWPTVQSDFRLRSRLRHEESIAQFNVETNSRYTPLGDLDTRCNIFAWDVMASMNAVLPHVVRGEERWIPYSANGSQTLLRYQKANRMFEWLQTHGTQFGWRTVTPSQAQSQANLGKPTVVIWHSRSNAVEKPGHVAVVRPTDVPFNSNDGGMVAQAGAVNRSSITVRAGFDLNSFPGRQEELRYWTFDR